MAEVNVIDARDQFAPTEKDAFQSGSLAEPGVYIDIDTGARITLYQQDRLPNGVRLVQFVRRFRRVEAASGEPETGLPHAAQDDQATRVA